METLDTSQISSFSVFQERSLNIGLIEVSVCYGFGLDQESIILYDTLEKQDVTFCQYKIKSCLVMLGEKKRKRRRKKKQVLMRKTVNFTANKQTRVLIRLH